MVRDELLTWADLSSEWPEVESSRVVYDVVTLEGADALLQTVPLVIGMSDTIGDTAAIVFARSFYAALASAQSVATALEQARMQMLATSMLDADQVDKSALATLRARDDADPTTVVLVRPSDVAP